MGQTQLHRKSTSLGHHPKWLSSPSVSFCSSGNTKPLVERSPARSAALLGREACQRSWPHRACSKQSGVTRPVQGKEGRGIGEPSRLDRSPGALGNEGAVPHGALPSPRFGNRKNAANTIGVWQEDKLA